MITCVVGAQYGSEGKGVVVKEMAHDYGIHVRTGGPNAGHSFVHEKVLYKMQSLPCGWVNPDALLVIGANATISKHQLLKEIQMLENSGIRIRNRLYIDRQANLISHEQEEEEGGINGELHKTIGSTGEGVGACRRDRILRGASKHPHQLVRDLPESDELSTFRSDTVAMLNGYRTSKNILLEGTQGFGLSLIHGPWPKVTSADTTAGQLAVDAGISPRYIDRVVLVARTMPIRVAGNSGPLNGETSWDELSKTLGRPVEERTTVTKKVRRIGEWDSELVSRAASVNGATDIALTFLDYVNPKDHGVKDFEALSIEGKKFVDMVTKVGNAPISYIGTGFSETEGWSYIKC